MPNYRDPMKRIPLFVVIVVVITTACLRVLSRIFLEAGAFDNCRLDGVWIREVGITLVDGRYCTKGAEYHIYAPITLYTKIADAGGYCS